ncbi:MAG: preprotein translocase subunit SecA [Clostridiales bacterium]|nr:preprotein translocase subunit SecA [Clostridiales bacterium]
MAFGLKNVIEAFIGTCSDRRLKEIRPICDSIILTKDKMINLSESEIREKTNKFKEAIKEKTKSNNLIIEAFVLIMEVIKRNLNINPFKVQIMGALILDQGGIAEMKTGEGKTLVAVMAAYVNALNENGVHIVTVNDYLAKRDKEWMEKVYVYSGLSVDCILHEMNDNERKEKYTKDVIYATNNELGFDYLRDNMVIRKEDRVQKKLNFAIIDEVDSILIDEARTPLIISGKGEKSTETYNNVEKFVCKLKHITIAENDDKEDSDEKFKKYDYIVEEKAKTSTLTESGVKKVEDFFGLKNLSDISNMTLSHHINQAIKAHGNMKRDIDYVVKNGEIWIVDEFTGRIMQGRRYSDGLHQAIEAKEKVKVRNESKVLATITFQNYFRLYKKLSGMTGTAHTEENEFQEIYHLDVVKIPTNKPLIRFDKPDVIYKTEKAKFKAVAEKTEKIHKTGQPLLVGTVSIEKSELLSNMLKKRGIRHNVLNAKFHEKEAEIIAQAGKKFAVTIATNMAGRGTDIILGGNAEFMAKKEMKRLGFSNDTISLCTSFVEIKDKEILNAKEKFNNLLKYFEEQTNKEQEEIKKLGGLYIIGTERHESRRIDNQLRGRSGRQGDPGYSRFYLSLEDNLMRLFGSQKIANVMNMLKMNDDEAIESKMVSNAIENAQKKVESHNFDIRKHVIQYDDVNNQQREIIYKQRNVVLNGKNIKENIVNIFDNLIEKILNLFIFDNQKPKNWNWIEMRKYFEEIFFVTSEKEFKPENYDFKKKTMNRNILKENLMKIVKEKYEEREKMFGEKIREIERIILLHAVDEKWIEHIDNMEQLKHGIHLQSYAQKDPIVEYKFEGMKMFNEMVESIKENTVKCLFNFKIDEHSSTLNLTNYII